MADLPFIASNPAIDEFNRANKVADETENAQLEREGKTLSNKTAAFKLQQGQAEAPTRLRQLTAAADTAAAKAPYAGPEAAAQLAQTRASTQATLAGMSNSQARLHMEAFTKEIEFLDAGDVEGAKRVAQSVGDQIPDQLIQNSQQRAAVKAITAAAVQAYPNRPKDQMTYIHAHISELASRAASGQTVNPQTAPYQEVPGVPVPQEIGSKNPPGETERIAQQIMAQHPGMTYAQAIEQAHGRGNQDTIAKERMAAANARADVNYGTDPVGTLNKWRAQYGLSGQAAPGAPPARPQTVPQGSAYSPSRNMWRDPQGNLYDANGQPQPSAAPAQAQPAPPSVPISQ